MNFEILVAVKRPYLVRSYKGRVKPFNPPKIKDRRRELEESKRYSDYINITDR